MTDIRLRIPGPVPPSAASHPAASADPCRRLATFDRSSREVSAPARILEPASASDEPADRLPATACRSSVRAGNCRAETGRRPQTTGSLSPPPPDRKPFVDSVTYSFFQGVIRRPCFPFSAVTLLAGRREGHPACKNPSTLTLTVT